MTLLVPALLLLSVFGSLSVGEVVKDFFTTTTCKDFFAPSRRPTVLNRPRYQQICQRLNNGYHYATLYDTFNKIPVYSAYRFLGIGGCDRKSSWYIEPQLDVNDPTLNNMAPESVVTNPFRGTNQAVNCDYEGTGYHKGHLAPVYQQNVQVCADATFTLTNAAPQDPSFNSGQWRITEEKVATHLTNNCLKNKWFAFIVTGVVPGGTWLKYRNVNTVNIPSLFWTAYCCVDNNSVNKSSGAYFGPNQNIPLQLKTTAQLDTELSKHYTSGFQVFGGNC